MNDPRRLDKLARLQALHATFAATLPERLEALTNLWRLVDQTSTWSESHTKLTLLAHSLAGSAGTFGYSLLGEKAKELENSLVQLQQRATPLEAITHQAITAQIATLHALGNDVVDR